MTTRADRASSRAAGRFRGMRRPTALALLLATIVALPASADAGTISIKTLSNRADLVSDGQALVGITLPRGAKALKVTLGRRTVTRAFSHSSGRRLRGMVSGLKVGKN